MLINLAYVLVPVAGVATGHQRLRLRVQLGVAARIRWRERKENEDR